MIYMLLSVLTTNVVCYWLSQIFFAHLCIFKNAKKKPAFKKKWMMLFDVWCLPLVMASPTELIEKSGNGAIWVAMDCFTIRPHSFSPKRFWNCHTRVKVSCHVRKSLFRWTFNSFGKFLPEKCIQNWCFFLLSSTWKENKQNLRNSDIKAKRFYWSIKVIAPGSQMLSLRGLSGVFWSSFSL